jgi:enoyl-[acyl-carrier protein] reductase II
MGTRFIMAKECMAHAKFKETFRKAKAKDAMATPQFDSRLPVIPVRALKNEGSIELAKLQLELLSKLDNNLIDRHEAQYKVEEFWAGALRQAVIEGDVARGSLMAGQSVGLVDKIQPLNEIIDEMVTGAESELQRLKGIFNRHDAP